MKNCATTLLITFILTGILMVVPVASSLSVSPGIPNLSPTSSTPTGLSVLSDGQFVFGPNVGNFDLSDFLSKRNDPLLKYADEILAQSEYFSINPRVLVAVLKVLYGDSYLEDDFPQAIHETAKELRAAFSWHRYNAGAMTTSKPPEEAVQFGAISFAPSSLNSASYAIAVVTSNTTGANSLQQIFYKFFSTYHSLFPESDPLDNSNNINPPGAPPSDMLQLPFPRGTWWKFNGPHNRMGGFGNYERPWSSMDFGLEGSCDAPPDMWAVAAASGYIQRRTTDFGLRIDHGNGWQTAYYHLRDIWSRFNPNGGDYVTQNTPLGRISCLYDPGGYADIPHVHFSLLYNGEFVDISRPNPSGDRTRLSGYQVYEGNAPYQGKLVREREIPVYNYVYNDAGSSIWATLNFTVKLENPQQLSNFNHSNQVAIVALKPGSKQILFGPSIISTNSSGYYGGLVLTGLQPGTYDICAKARHYLGQCARNVIVIPGSTINIDFSNGGSTPAWLGDIDLYGEDNEANVLDWERIRSACISYCGRPYPEFDMNRDGRFDTQDVSLVGYRVAHDFRGEGVFNRPFTTIGQASDANQLSAATSGNGTISIQPDFRSGWIGDIINASIVIDTGGDSISGVDAIVYYDPAILEVLDEDGSNPGIQITNAGLFPNVYRNNVDASNGIIRFSAGYGNSNNQFSGTGTLATWRFRVIAATPPLFYTTVKPVVNPDTSDDSNGAQFNMARDILASSWVASYNLYGTQQRPSPTISLSLPSESVINQNLLDISAIVNEPYNQVECVTFSLLSALGDSVSASDCDGSDGWSTQLDISSMPDQNGLTLQADAILRATPTGYIAKSTNITLDRTPPELRSISFNPDLPLHGDSVQINIDVWDDFSPYVITEFWVNTANDSSENGEWVRVDTALFPPLRWDTTNFSIGSHLVAVTLRDHAGNWQSWNRVITIRPREMYLYLPLVNKNYNLASPPIPPSNLLATPISSSQIQLDWNDNSINEEGFTIYDGSIFVDTVPPNTVTYIVGGLSPGSYHCFHIYAFNRYGASSWTDWACATTLDVSDPDDERIINFNQTLYGTIDPAADEDIYYFDASADATVNIRMDRTGGNLDCYLLLYDPEGNLIAQDDDGGGYPNALIQIVLSSNGRYRVVARSYGHMSTGTYAISLSH